MLVLDIQRRLLALGFDPGPLDNAWGPRSRAALGDFQANAGLVADGMMGPKTTAALNIEQIAAPSGAQISPKLTAGEPIWVLEGRRRLGLREGAPKLKAFLKSDGRTLGDPEKLPWCGDFVETCVRIALPDEPVPPNPYLARNWLSFGTASVEPVFGAVAVFSRGTSATSGHVGFVMGADRTFLSILGGNQANSVSVSRLRRSRALGFRWPRTAERSPAAPLAKATGSISVDEA